MHSLKSAHLIGQNFLSRFLDRDSIQLDPELISLKAEHLPIPEFVILYPLVPKNFYNWIRNFISIDTFMHRIIFLLNIDRISLHVTYPWTSLLSVMYLNCVSCCSIACDNSFSHWRSLINCSSISRVYATEIENSPQCP